MLSILLAQHFIEEALPLVPVYTQRIVDPSKIPSKIPNYGLMGWGRTSCRCRTNIDATNVDVCVNPSHKISLG